LEGLSSVPPGPVISLHGPAYISVMPDLQNFLAAGNFREEGNFLKILGESRGFEKAIRKISCF